MLRVTDPRETVHAARILADLDTSLAPTTDPAAGEIRPAVADPFASARAVRRLDAHHLALTSITLDQPSLDDVFLAITGRPTAMEAA